MSDLRDRLAAALAPRYIVDREFAAGGMGTVYLGRDPTLGREVAVKVLPPERATAVAVERFLREARVLARLAHPHIVTILEAQQADDLLWYVMPRMDGDTLAHRIAIGPLPPNELRRLGLDLLGALEHAHKHGVIHRDIKPANVFLQSGRGMLADFGVALFDSPHEDTLTAPDQVVGTLRYMAPEQSAGGDATERSDLYSLAVTLFEAATGRRWDATAAVEPRTWRGLSPPLSRALRGALHGDPARRWPDAATFRKELAKRSRFTRQTAVLAGAGLIVLVGGTIATVSRIASGSVASARAAIVVLRFTGTDSALGERLARYTSFPLEFSPIGVIPFSRVNQMKLEAGQRVAQNVVTGTIVSHGAASAVLEIAVYDTAGTLVQPILVPGDPDDAPTWGRATADSIVKRLFRNHLTEFRLLSGNPNRQAVDTFLAGQALFQRGAWGAAESAYRVAESLDTTFVRASWAKLIARQWQRLPFEEDLARLAARRLPPPLDELVRVQMEPDLTRRIDGYAQLVARYPDFPPLRELQANELFSRGPLVGHPLSEGIDAFRLAAADIPELDQATTYTQTVWGAVRIGKKELAADQLTRRRALPGDPWTGLLWLAVKGRFQRWLAVPVREFTLAIADSSDIATLSKAVRIGLEVDDPWEQEAIGRKLERRAATKQLSASALAGQATALLLLGRPQEALVRLDRGAAAVPGDHGFQLQRAEWRVLLPLIPRAPIDIPASEREWGRQALRAVPTGDSLWPRAAWALAVDAIARGHRSERDSLLAGLHARSATDTAVAEVAVYAEAIARGADGDIDSALALSARIHRVAADFAVPTRGPFVRALIYLHRGEWRLTRDGGAGAESEWLWHENNDVQGWPDREPEEGEIDAALSGVARLIRAENLTLLDRGQQACEMLVRLDQLWGNAEPSFQTLRHRVDAGRKPCRN